MRVWIDPDRLAALNLAPGDVYAALQRNNYLAAVGQTKGNLVQVNLLANTDLRTADEFENLIVAERKRRHRPARVTSPGSSWARRKPTWSPSSTTEEGGLPRRLAAGRRQRDRGRRTGSAPRWTGSARRCRRTSTCSWRTTARCSWSDALKEITQDAGRDHPDRRSRRVPVHGLGPHRAGAAGGDADLAGRRRDRHAAFGFSLNLLTILAIVLSVGLVVDDAIVVVENVERHVREGQSRIEAALIGARELVGPIIAMTITLAAVYTPIGFQGGLTGSLFLEFAITLAAAVVVSGHRGGHAVAGDELAVRARARAGGPADRAGESRLRGGAPDATRACWTGRSGCAGRSSRPPLLVMLAAWPLYSYSRQGAGAGRGPEPHQPLHAGVARRVAGRHQPRVARGGARPSTAFPEAQLHVVSELPTGAASAGW